MKYIVFKRYKKNSSLGRVNLPAMTECECDGSVIYYNEKPICNVKSKDAHQFFYINDDGKGLQRGNLIHDIQGVLSKHDSDYQNRWNKIWKDKLCRLYKREDYNDVWLWDHTWYSAPIEDLQYIAKLIGIKVSE